jgi:hypothetical protein
MQQKNGHEFVEQGIKMEAEKKEKSFPNKSVAHPL